MAKRRKSNWQYDSHQVTNLKLDPENPRIPESDANLSQDRLISELVEHDKVRQLARQITRISYLPDSLLVTVKENGNHYVVEGNRRLAALKCLLNPSAAPDEHESHFRRLADRSLVSIPDEVPVLIAPSREATLPLVQTRHTGEQIEKWSRAMQARFYRREIKRGASVEELAQRFGKQVSEIQDYLKADKLYQMANSLDLPEDVKEKVGNPRTYDLTNLERILDSEPGRRKLCVDRDPKHVYRGKIKRQEFARGFGRIVSDIARGKITSRDVNNNAQIETYLTSIKGELPDPKKSGRFKADDLIKTGKATGAEPPAQPARKKKAQHKKQSKSVIPSGYPKPTVDRQRVHDVFRELKSMSAANYPNSSALLLRALLELATDCYIKQRGIEQEMMQHVRKRRKKGANYIPTVRERLEYLLNQDTVIPGSAPDAKKAVEHLIGARQGDLPLEVLHGYTHNSFMTPNEQALRSLWISLEPLFNVILYKPEEDGAS